jgi:integrase
LTVRKRCGCAQHDERCPHPWIYEPMVNGLRRPWVDIDRYAAARGGPQHVRSAARAMEWAALIRLDWLNGRDPRQTPTEQTTATRPKTVADLVDAYRRANAAHPDQDRDPETGRVPAPRLKQPQVVWSELRHIQAYFADMPATDLEQESRVRQFQEELADGWTPEEGKTSARGESGVRHLLVRLRAVIRWGMFQRTSWLKTCPFHRYGLAIEGVDDTRTRRLFQWEEAALLAACRTMADQAHKQAGVALERRLLGALYLGGRGSDLDRVRVEHISFHPAKGWPSVLFVGRERGGGKATHDRRVPFDPHGPLAPVLEARRFLKPPHDFVFGDDDGRLISHYRAWTTARLLAWQLIRPDGAGRTPIEDQRLLRETVNLQFRDLRRECASRWWDAGVRERRIQLLLGHSTLLMTQRYLQLPEGDDTGEDVATALGWSDAVNPLPRAGELDRTTSELRVATGSRPKAG